MDPDTIDSVRYPFDGWFGAHRIGDDADEIPERIPLFGKSGVRIPSTTVFCGDTAAWAKYLNLEWKMRGNAGFSSMLRVVPESPHLEFTATDSDSAQIASVFQSAWETAWTRATSHPVALGALSMIALRTNPEQERSLEIVTDNRLPAPAIRESPMDHESRQRIVLQHALLDEATALSLTKSSKLESLGAIWPIFQHLLLQLSYPDEPRDRFTERIEQTTRIVALTLALFYDGKKNGRLDPNRGGLVFEEFESKRLKLPKSDLRSSHPWFRLLEDASFLIRGGGDPSTFNTAKILVRDYLDSLYLRIGVADLMPGTPAWLNAIRVDLAHPRNVNKAKLAEGKFGMVDDEDLHAWRKVRGPLEDMGYYIVRQLGMGQFGRVYEAINAANSSVPSRVAIKVDRIRKNQKKGAIEQAETILQTASGLSPSPHVIRVFDAGVTRKKRWNYHILQLVDGDTLDNLIGTTGMEHASVLRPSMRRSSTHEVEREASNALAGSTGEAWRQARKSHPFLYPPTLQQALDLLTSKLLWVEEVHRLGFAVNDLKNGNVMLNRRGQFKGIDLDAYSPVFSPVDKRTDFFFLAISTFHLVSHVAAEGSHPDREALKAAISDPGSMQEFLTKRWPWGNVERLSGGRIAREDIADLFAELIESSRSGRFAENPDAFSDAINRVIRAKRELADDELVVE